LVWVRSLFSAAMWRAGVGDQGQVVGALPGREGHALGERSQHCGIDGIGLGAGLHRLSETFGGLEVDHHAGQPSVIQSEGEGEVILAGGLQADTAHLRLTQAVAQGRVALGGILEFAGLSHAAIAVDDQSSGFAADIDSVLTNTAEEHREARERKRRAKCDAPRVGVGPSVWSECGA